MENVVNEKHLWLSHIWTGCSQGTRLLIHSHNLQLRGKWWWTYWGGAALKIMTFESCHLKFQTWLGICGSFETPEPIWIWNLVSQIRQLIIIVRLKWQCWMPGREGERHGGTVIHDISRPSHFLWTQWFWRMPQDLLILLIKDTHPINQGLRLRLCSDLSGTVASVEAVATKFIVSKSFKATMWAP